MSKLFFILLLCLCGSCRDKNSDINVRVSARYDRDLVPNYLILTIKNDGESTICSSVAENQLGRNFKIVGDRISSEYDKPSEDFLSGIDISEGIRVFKPKRKTMVLVYAPELFQSRASQRLSGKVGFWICKDVFKERAAVNIIYKIFSVRL